MLAKEKGEEELGLLAASKEGNEIEVEDRKCKLSYYIRWFSFFDRLLAIANNQHYLFINFSFVAANDWLALHTILTSKHTFSESLYDLDGINKVLGDVAQIDRLPSTNTLEGSLLLQTAWDCVDCK